MKFTKEQLKRFSLILSKINGNKQNDVTEPSEFLSGLKNIILLKGGK